MLQIVDDEHFGGAQLFLERQGVLGIERAQEVAHEILGVDFHRIKVFQGDTLYVPYSTSTWGSRSMVMGGGAVARASRLLATRAGHIGAWLLQADPAQAVVKGGNVMVDNAHVSLRDVGRAWYLQPQNLPPDVDTGGLEVTAGYRAERDSGTFTYATHAAVVAVDPETGHIEIPVIESLVPAQDGAERG